MVCAGPIVEQPGARTIRVSFSPGCPFASIPSAGGAGGAAAGTRRGAAFRWCALRQSPPTVSVPALLKANSSALAVASKLSACCSSVRLNSAGLAGMP